MGPGLKHVEADVEPLTMACAATSDTVPSVLAVGLPAGADASWTLPATPEAPASMRRHATGFAAAAGVTDELAHSVALAVSEAVTNVVLHAYVGRAPGTVSVTCEAAGRGLLVRVADEGAGVSHRTDSPGLGHGLAIVGSLVQSLDVTARPGGGTVVTMTFGDEVAETDLDALAPLVVLGLERVADVVCVDEVRDGVLRRVAAEVTADPEATAWLRQSLPPAKPGTATWDALREGGARLVVHDPSVPRSPGGPGERLGLTWWVSIAIDGPDGQPAALWGLGGRDGGRPVPSAGVLHELSVAANRAG